MGEQTVNGKALNALGLLASLGAVAAFVVGIVIGQQNAMASASDRFVSRAQYDKDQSRLESELGKVNEKLDELIRRGR